MKKLFKKVVSTGLAVSLGAFALAGCSNTAQGTNVSETNEEVSTQDNSTDTVSSGSAEDKKIIVGAGITPHAELLREVQDVLAKDGYTLEVIEYNDYILPNTALFEGDLDANFFQHQPYLDNFNKENETDLISVASIHFEPLGIYAGKTTSLDDLQEGAIVAVPNDATNEARALLLLESNELITLKEGVGVNATVLDIVENPLNLKIQEIAAEQVVRALPDVDIACINGNYALEGGLTADDAISVEESDSLSAETYKNVVAVKEGHENDEKIQALVNALLSEENRQYIEEKYQGAVVPVF